MSDDLLKNTLDSFTADKELCATIFLKQLDQTFTYQDLLNQINKNPPLEEISEESPFLAFSQLLTSLLHKKQALVHKKNNLPPLSSNLKDHLEQNSFYLMSSGSTGFPKKIGLSLENIYFSANTAISLLMMKPGDISVLNLSHFHIAGLMVLWRAFLSKGSILINPDSEAIYQYTSLVPLQLRRVLTDEEKLKTLKKCKMILVGGGYCDPALKIQAGKMGLNIFETYGMTETASFVLLIGKTIPGASVDLDADKCIMIKGPMLSESVDVDEDGFYHTKDLGEKNHAGRIVFSARKDFLFKSAGVLVNPSEIEKVLSEIPDLENAFSTSIPHFTWDNSHILVTSSPVDSDSSIAILKNKLPSPMVPKYIWEYPKEFCEAGIKPSRHHIKNWAAIKWLSSLFNYVFIPGLTTKKLIVVFHGFMEDQKDWNFLLESDKNNSYLFIDLPGHGQTSTKNFQSAEEIYFYLNEIIKIYRSHFEELILLGYSMGGRIAVELINRGLKAQHLILHSASVGLNNEDKKDDRFLEDQALFNDYDKDKNAFFSKWYSNPIFYQYNQDIHFSTDISKKLTHDYKEWQKSLSYFSPGASVFNIEETLLNFKQIPEMKISAIVGSEDLKYKKHFQSISLLSKNCHIIQNAGHKLHVTHKKEFIELVASLI